MEKILGVPLSILIIASLFTIVVSAAMLYPALSNFGHQLVGAEDIKFFIWLFWHYESSLHQGTNPLFANEIFYPDGIWLSRTPTSTIPALLYLVMPQAWGPFGRITIIQLLSLVLGGILSFAFCYRLLKASSPEDDFVIPAMLGSIVYNFSTFHLLSITHEMNYAMAIAFIPLFFIFYLDIHDKRGDARVIACLGVSLLLIALSEITVVMMLGLIVSVDIALAYMRHGRKTIGSKEVVILFISGVLALVLSTLLGLDPRFIIAEYLLPPAVFIASTIFFVIGADQALHAEKDLELVQSLAIASIPTCAYIIAILLLPAYQMAPDLVLLDNYKEAIPLQTLLLPASINAVGNFFHISQPVAAETGLYLGYGMIAMVAISFFFKGAGKDEVRFRDLMLISLLFAFPIIGVGDQFIAASPFFPQTLFPMLPVLRVPARFMIFTMFFASGCICLAAERVIRSKWRYARTALLILAILILVEIWPAYSSLMFTQSVPSFYTSIAAAGSHPAIFLYPDIGYYEVLNEAYYQTIHHSQLSYGVLSRVPAPTDMRTSIYWGNATDDEIVGFAEDNGFDYVVVQKTGCKRATDCFMGNYTMLNESILAGIEGDMERSFGKPVYEDDTMLAYQVIRNQS